MPRVLLFSTMDAKQDSAKRQLDMTLVDGHKRMVYQSQMSYSSTDSKYLRYLPSSLFQ